jgi:hypothetical protein
MAAARIEVNKIDDFQIFARLARPARLARFTVASGASLARKPLCDEERAGLCDVRRNLVQFR